MAMKRVMKICAASAMGLLINVMPPMAAMAAEAEVLQSTGTKISVGAKLQDDAPISIPEGGTLRVLIVSSGATKTLNGPYEGTISAYEEKHNWWNRLFGKNKDEDPPVGATRGLRPQQ
jgi:hypothetical protein